MISLTRDLPALRTAACAEIDAAAEAARAGIATTGSLQALTYQRKEAEARDLLAGGTGVHPLLEAEATATGVTVADLAATVVAAADAWLAAAARIEASRMVAKAAVRAAVSPAAIRAAIVAHPIEV